MTDIHQQFVTVLQEVSDSLQIDIGLEQQFGKSTSSTKDMLKLLKASICLPWSSYYTTYSSYQEGHLLVLDASTLLSLGEDVGISTSLVINNSPVSKV